LLARYAWTRPLVYRLAGVLVVAYTVVVAVDDKTALFRWLFGLFVALVGWGLARAAPELSASDLKRWGRGSWRDPMVWFERLLRRLSLPVIRRIEFVMGVTLIVVGVASAVASPFAL
jgi:hypothetical protein